MPTHPGYDPGRALTNCYAVKRVETDIMLGFFFPGAALGAAEEHEAAVQGPLVARTS